MSAYNSIPLMLTSRHEEEFQKRAIPKEFALADGYRTIADNEAHGLGFGACLPFDQRKQGLQGILIPVGGTNGDGCPRLKPDNRIIIGGKAAKYLSRKGDPPRIFEPHTNLPEYKTDPSVDLVIVESPFKASAVAANVIPIYRRPLAVIGLQGINTAWSTPKKVADTPDGGRERRKSGPPQLNPDFDQWIFRDRRVWTGFDSDVASIKHAEAYAKCRTAGAIGAEATLARLLRDLGADVLIIELPNEPDGSKNGPDDFIAQYGAEAFIERMRRAVRSRDIEVLLARALIRSAATALAPQPEVDWLIRDLVQRGAVVADVGDAGTLKTYANIDKCVCLAMGEDWINHRTKSTRVLIVDEESGDARLARRIGDTMRGHNAQADLSLGYVSLLGLNLRVSKDMDRLRALIEAHEAGFVLIDSWAAVVAGADENAVSEIQPVLINLRRIAERTGCAIQLIHHTNRNGGYRGTTAFKAALDLMMLSERRPGDELIYTCEKARDAVVMPFSAKAYFALGKFWLAPLQLRAGAEAPKLTPSETEVLEFVRQAGRATIEGIAKGVRKTSPETARRSAWALAKHGWIARVDHGGKGREAMFEPVRNEIAHVDLPCSGKTGASANESRTGWGNEND